MPARSNHFLRSITFSATLVASFFLVKGVELLFQLPLTQYGVVPRTAVGLPGIIFSPFIHADLKHLLANAIPMFFMLTLLLINKEYRPFRTLALIWLASGLGTWLIGRPGSVHIGASSVIFGLAAFLIVAGFKIRSWNSALIGLLVLFFYGGIFSGALPQNGPISWEGHLSGALAGLWIATKAQRSRAPVSAQIRP